MEIIEISLNIACARFAHKMYSTHGIPFSTTLNRLKEKEDIYLKCWLLKDYFFKYPKENNEYLIEHISHRSF